MQEVKLLHIEDDPGVRESVALWLAARGLHRVAAEANSFPAALRRLKDIDEKLIKIDAILLDGNLEKGVAMNHPLVIRNKMNELGIKLPVIGYSGNGLAEKGLVVGTDIVADLIKGRDEELLIKVLDELPEQASLVKS